MPLDDLPNQARPPRRLAKVYGKKRGILGDTMDMHRDLFGSDENEIERQLAKLIIAPDTQPLPASPPPSPRKSTRKVTPAKRITKAEGPKRKRRMAHLSTGEALELSPLLCQLGVNAVVETFESFANNVTARGCKISKVGDGSYGECFSLTGIESSDIMAILKSVSFHLKSDGCQEDDKPSSNIDDVTREVKVLQAMQDLHGFAQSRSMHVVRGKYPEQFLSYKEDEADPVEEEHPLAFHGPDTFHLLIEMENAGKDLENLLQPSAFQAYDAFWKTAILMAKAEEKVEFEHRDLHLSNICYDPCTAKLPESVLELECIPQSILGLSGLKVSIIDFTLSRARVGTGVDDVVFSPHGAFSGEGLRVFDDELGAHQQATGLKARKWAEQRAVGRPPGENKYKQFLPKTNVIWLSHVLKGLLYGAKKNGAWRRMQGSSVVSANLQIYLWRELMLVFELINQKNLDLLPDGATDLVELALKKGWFRPEDVDKMAALLGE